VNLPTQASFGIASDPVKNSEDNLALAQAAGAAHLDLQFTSNLLSLSKSMDDITISLIPN